MILPRLRSIIPGATARAQRNMEVRLVTSTSSHSSSVTSSDGLSSVTPALLTRTSMGPSVRSASVTAARIPSALVTSSGIARARPPAASISAATDTISALARAAQATLAPASAKARAMARPRPRLAPVTNAVRPSREKRRSVVLPPSRCPLPLKGRGRGGEALGHQLAETVLLDLAAGGHGKLGDDLKPLGKLVARELLALEIDGDLAQGERLPFAGNHHGAAALHEPRVGHGHDGHAGDLGMRVEEVLHLDHGDVLAAADDDVLAPPRDGDVAVAVQGGAIARLEPAVPRVAVGGELRALVVADELEGAAHEEIALHPRRNRRAVAVHHRELHAAERRAVGLEDFLFRILEPVASHEAVLRPAPSRRDDAPEPLPRVLHELARDRRARGDEDAQRAEVGSRVQVGQVAEEWRGPHGEGDALGLHEAGRGLSVPDVHPHHGGAQEHG